MFYTISMYALPCPLKPLVQRTLPVWTTVFVHGGVRWTREGCMSLCFNVINHNWRKYRFFCLFSTWLAKVFAAFLTPPLSLFFLPFVFLPHFMPSKPFYVSVFWRFAVHESMERNFKIGRRCIKCWPITWLTLAHLNHCESDSRCSSMGNWVLWNEFFSWWIFSAFDCDLGS